MPGGPVTFVAVGSRGDVEPLAILAGAVYKAIFEKK